MQSRSRGHVQYEVPSRLCALHGNRCGAASPFVPPPPMSSPPPEITPPPPPLRMDTTPGQPLVARRILCRIHGQSVSCCRSPKDLGFTLTCIDAYGAMHMFPISNRDGRPGCSKLCSRLLSMFGCRFGCRLRSCWGHQLFGIHFPSGMSRVKYSSSPKVWPNPQVPQLQWHHVCTQSFCTDHHGEKGLAQQPAHAPLWNGHSAQQRLEGTFSQV